MFCNVALNAWEQQRKEFARNHITPSAVYFPLFLPVLVRRISTCIAQKWIVFTKFLFRILP